MSYLASKGVTLNDLAKQFQGNKLGKLVIHHINEQSFDEISLGIIGLEEGILGPLKESTNDFLNNTIMAWAERKVFWDIDCGEALILYTTATKAEAKKFGLEVDDDYAYDFFNLMILSLARRAILDSKFKKHIIRSYKPFWKF